MLILNLGAYLAADVPQRGASMKQAAAMLGFLVVTLLLVRGGWLRHGLFAPLMYRVALYGSVQLSYFFLGGLLPILNDRMLDTELYELDLALFGFEPALAMDAWVTSLTTEWFAFFYFTYFFILALHVIPVLFGTRNQQLLGEFTLGMMLVFCIGHVGYMLVPGYGPYWALADQFSTPLPSGLWSDIVMVTVASGGSQLDIFPSLHTAAPTFITLFSFRYRRLLPFRYTWIPVAFVTANIICATMFLRWHYVIDVVIGLILATLVSVLAARLTDRELARRTAAGLSPNWPLFTRSAARASTEAANPA